RLSAAARRTRKELTNWSDTDSRGDRVKARRSRRIVLFLARRHHPETDGDGQLRQRRCRRGRRRSGFAPQRNRGERGEPDRARGDERQEQRRRGRRQRDGGEDQRRRGEGGETGDSSEIGADLAGDEREKEIEQAAGSTDGAGFCAHGTCDGASGGEPS